ncbi:MAG: hypothetical protein LBN39_08965 [Planctomycetaceae bacterium]|jgi:hypothetical protein|nr:hypothetical protein [Planctomycetaceae bacterium]
MTRSGFFFIICIVLGFAGCRSDGRQPLNPFAMNRQQTAPPPATFSSQAAYLGQTPSVYVPQSPATVYPGAVTPGTTSPVGAPLPNSAVPPTAEAAPMEKTAAAWTPAPAVAAEWNAPNVSSDVPIAETRQTAFQNLESKTNTIATVSADGTQTALTVQPEKLAVSSAQTVTKIAE